MLSRITFLGFRLGDVESLRGAMPGRGLLLEAGRLYWLTDRYVPHILFKESTHFSTILHLHRTPHESLPIKEGAFRQFFRLVTSQVSLWYADHSTPNPLGVLPDPDVTRIVTGDKFGKDGVELVEENALKKKKHRKHKHKHRYKDD